MSYATADAGIRDRSRPMVTRQLDDPVYQSFMLLRIGFAVAPIAFGLDKFFNVMVNWEQYLAPWVNRLMPGTATDFMYLVGVIEIAAGLAVALKPRYGAYLVAAWLAGIIINLLTYSGYYDIALRDFGLLLGALTLARLATLFDPPGLRIGSQR
ncbi:MAG TPA: DoxX family protein [Acetobacteraceae bacterium]|nr:DoxX family protein [Acetobacteraceae bacterium]